ncbi:hypothetical protein C0584_01660 [Candidatus Parcubacteria bacterium]|nr:MAG: hypothetical protein C0584_01660 [Candidatus Parcubacteria bacterium]
MKKINPQVKAAKIEKKHLAKHETKREILFRFLILIAILGAYFVYLTLEHGLGRGFSVLLITWSFFVLCTPIADAGFILDFPIRLFLRIKMFVSEVVVWVIAILINISFLLFRPEIYNSDLLTKIFKEILTNPFPYWSIIILSGIGTFLSVSFGDELLDVIRYKDRKLFNKRSFIAKSVFLFSVFIIIFILYDILIYKLGLNTVFAR